MKEKKDIKNKYMMILLHINFLPVGIINIKDYFG
jgi:hypothetical protein